MVFLHHGILGISKIIKLKRLGSKTINPWESLRQAAVVVVA